MQRKQPRHTHSPRVEDGRFAEVWHLADMGAVMRQIGGADAVDAPH
jgi:predicted ester cyclase